MAHIVLYVINPEEYFKHVVAIFKKEAQKKSVVYVTTNKPYNSVMRSLKQAGVNADRIFFIDCISQDILGEKLPEEPDNCLFVESPKSLTAMSIAIHESVKHLEGEKLLFLDSLSTLLIYNDANTIGRFSNFLVNKMRSYDVQTIILSVETDMDKNIIKQIESFVDEVRHNGS
jgi:KaiC/GvpD/RAD55 family RecA-like ATPase